MRIAFVTMVWQDQAFLDLWLRYYGAMVGRAHLYVLNHGGDPGTAAQAEGANVLAIPRDPPDARFDQRRWAMLSDIASGLSRIYDIVVVGDVDELILPLTPGLSLAAHLQACPPQGLSAPAGYELFPDQPDPIDLRRPVLRQAGEGVLSGAYSKPCLLTGPVRLGAGGHGSRTRFALRPDLALLHLRFLPLPGQEARRRERAALARAASAEASRSFLAGWRRAETVQARIRARFEVAPRVPSAMAAERAGPILEAARRQKGALHGIDMQQVRRAAFRLVLDEALRDLF
ncbi:hypothetical protein KM176_14260 [Pseudooceanicola sp. CBS1P-1]|uniref:Glycosyltransferase family 2 protein n=1 Tax=Pseudooceanicola albus TaxID=2692189 RepID=A0A6L7G3C2_9RHOB|nr:MULTISPECIES: glycosyltransferase family 2 protein [Pseudooceanicola]MBT9385029.1 hypothetical protein [Pseudooceanicola endophyticus]MXN17977.1 hypothetical protein [Pseudooceanicola albus]